MNVVFSYLSKLIKNVNQLKIIIYGTKNKCLSIYNYFCVLNITSYIEGFIYEDHGEVSSEINNIKIFSIYDLLYLKDEVCVIVAGRSNDQAVSIINNICNSIPLYLWYFDSAHRADIIDPLLGYSRNGSIEGYVIHQYKESYNPLKILVTGGSTTDGTFANIKAWPEILSGFLKEQEIAHIIYNGGIVGYNSSQELMKVIRDISVLSPHIVISYSGINDFYRGTNNFQHPYTPLHLSKNIFPLIEKNLKTINEVRTNSDMCTPTKISYGVDYDYSGSEIWYKNMKRIAAIASNENSSFYGFLQPCAFSKGYKLEKELYQYIMMQHSERAVNEIKNNIKDAETLISGENTIYSLNDIFNDWNYIFYDHCHCSEIGNTIIAKEIYKIIKDDEHFRNFGIVSR